MLITNTPKFGGDVHSELFKVLASTSTDRLRMVSGYVGQETIEMFRAELTKRSHVAVDLVVGMAAREGLSQGTYDALLELNGELKARKHRTHSRQGVYAYFSGPNGERSRGMHAKAYLFNQGRNRRLLVGSSNFSSSGLTLEGNVEVNVVDTRLEVTKHFEDFFEGLHHDQLAVPIDKIVNFPIRGRSNSTRESAEAALVKVKAPSAFKTSKYVDIDLARNIERQQRSNLNCCFGKGRWARSSGVVTPRDWYEVELISPTDVTSNPNYPKGEFDVLTTDGFSFKAVTNGDYFKNLRSLDDLKILGLWIKGLLEDAGALSNDPQELVTEDTFKRYGNSILRIYRPSAKSAIFHFPRSAKSL